MILSAASFIAWVSVEVDEVHEVAWARNVGEDLDPILCGDDAVAATS